jgi:Fe-S-cluster containining protein
MSELRILDEAVAARCGATTAAHPDWPCRAGCADCCRSLAQVPALTAAEWDRLEAAVPAAHQPAVNQRIAAVLRQNQGPYACPWLDPERDVCLVYEARPIACRTYGFYVERDQGLYCRRIAARVDAGEIGDVVWGNQEAIDSQLDRLGPRQTLADRIRATGPAA